MPNHKKIINVDLLTGEILWVNDDLTYYDMDENFIYGYASKFEDREFYQLAIENGIIKNNLGNEEQSKPILNSISEKDFSKYTFTEMMSESPSSAEIREITTKIIGDNFYFNFCEYIDKGNILIFNYYDKIAPQSLINRLVIYDKIDEKPILIETLNSSTPAPVPDSFFMYDDELYFIKDKTELVAYRLNL